MTPQLPHAAFLERVAALDEGDGSEARLALAGYLALRLVDQLTSPELPASGDVAFWYQHRALRRHLSELGAELGHRSAELNHLSELVNAAEVAGRRGQVGLAAPPVLAYAFYLEQELRLPEALDVLNSVRGIAALAAGDDAVACELAVGRVNRKLARFDDAEAAYVAAGRRAQAVGDRHAVYLSRIGRAGIRLRRGNLPEARRQLEEVRADAEAAGDLEAVARAEHDLGVVLATMGQQGVAIRHAFRAYQLYRDSEKQLWALHDVGVMLKEIGDYGAARDAFMTVYRLASSWDTTAHALPELMDCASLAADRIAFAKWRRSCQAIESRLTPELRADLHLKLGLGFARFGDNRRARVSLERAMSIALAAQLHELEFRLEELNTHLRDRLAEEGPRQPDTQSADWIVTRDVAGSLAKLARSGA